MKNKKVFLLIVAIILAFATAILIGGCSGKSVEIAVMSDVHFLAQELFTAESYEKYSNVDKMEHLSETIMRTVKDKLKASKPKFLLVSGDLTENGDKRSHEVLATIFKEIENNGTEVFVINGNHDVAVKYESVGAKVTQEEFFNIYADFGYNQAVAKCEGTLSYSADLGKNHRLIAVDNIEYFIDSEGEIKKSSLSVFHTNWIKEQITLCQENGRTPIIMSHIPFKNHFPKIVASLQEDATSLSMAKYFADNGVRCGFTGHLHVSDIQEITTEDGGLFYDIANPSMVFFPCAYRMVKLKKNGFSTETVKVESLNEEYLPKFISEEDKNLLMNGLQDYSLTFMRREITKHVLKLDKPNGLLGSLVSGDSSSAQVAKIVVRCVQEALSTPIYIKDETDGISIERTMKKYGVDLPAMEYKTVLEMSTVYASSVFIGERGLKGKTETEFISTFVYYILECINQKSAEIAEYYPDININIDMQNLVNTGKLECYDSGIVPLIIAIAGNGTAGQLIKGFIATDFNDLKSLDELLASMTMGTARGITDYFKDKEIALYDLMYDGVLGKYAPEIMERKTDIKYEK